MVEPKELAYLKVQLAVYQQLQNILGPIDFLPLQTLLEEDDSIGGSGGQKKDYVDFLLPLPEHLQSREQGIADPVVVKQSKNERGINTNISKNNKQEAEKKLKNQLQNQLKNKPQGPAPKMKKSIRPNPYYGTTSSTTDEE